MSSMTTRAASPRLPGPANCCTPCRHAAAFHLHLMLPSIIWKKLCTWHDSSFHEIYWTVSNPAASPEWRQLVTIVFCIGRRRLPAQQATDVYSAEVHGGLSWRPLHRVSGALKGALSPHLLFFSSPKILVPMSLGWPCTDKCVRL